MTSRKSLIISAARQWGKSALAQLSAFEREILIHSGRFS